MVRRPRADEAPVPIIAEIVRVPEDPVEQKKKNKGKRRGTTKPPSSRGASKNRELYIDNPEEGMDAETEESAWVKDFGTEDEVQKSTSAY